MPNFLLVSLPSLFTAFPESENPTSKYHAQMWLDNLLQIVRFNLLSFHMVKNLLATEGQAKTEVNGSELFLCR